MVCGGCAGWCGSAPGGDADTPGFPALPIVREGTDNPGVPDPRTARRADAGQAPGGQWPAVMRPSAARPAAAPSGVTLVVGADWREGTRYEASEEDNTTPDSAKPLNGADETACMHVDPAYTW